MGQEMSSLEGFTHHMVQHTRFTVDYNTAVVSGFPKKQKDALNGLAENMTFWKPELINSYELSEDKADDWIVIFLEHILFVKDYIDGTHTNNKKLAEKGLNGLVSNKTKVVDFFNSLEWRSSDLDSAWTEHLNCTKDYVETSKMGIGNINLRSNRYVKSTGECVEIGYRIGYMLDQRGSMTWDEAKAIMITENKMVSEVKKEEGNLVEVTIGKSLVVTTEKESSPNVEGLIDTFTSLFRRGGGGGGGGGGGRKSTGIRGAFYPFTALLKIHFEIFEQYSSQLVHKDRKQVTRAGLVKGIMSTEVLSENQRQWSKTFEHYGFRTRRSNVQQLKKLVTAAIEDFNRGIAGDIADIVVFDRPGGNRFLSKPIANYYTAALEASDEEVVSVENNFQNYEKCLRNLAGFAREEQIFKREKVACLILIRAIGQNLDHNALEYQTLEPFDNFKSREKQPIEYLYDEGEEDDDDDDDDDDEKMVKWWDINEEEYSPYIIRKNDKISALDLLNNVPPPSSSSSSSSSSRIRRRATKYH